MRSFANYRWVITVSVVCAVLLVYFEKPRQAEAQGTPATPGGAGTTPTGPPSSSPCLKGEGTGPPPPGDYGDCTRCNVFSGRHETVDEARVSSANYTVVADADGADFAGNGASIDGSIFAAGSGGSFDAHGGGFTCAMPLGVSTDGGFT